MTTELSTWVDPKYQRFYEKLRQKIKGFAYKAGKPNDVVIEYILLLPDLFVLLLRLMKDKRISIKNKAMLGAAIAYVVSPVDFIPEAVFGPVGFTDDLIAVIVALNKIMNDTPYGIIREHWSGEKDIIDTIQRILNKADDLVGRGVYNKILGIFNK
ncbi:YkvA family protein [Desulfolucanica intricata]|uniref:YkvA family protein n=1 Tax=Desulfolucanica intricata TaxID=1285191 RepID=UPI00082CED10|nr:DUF1232 domain-containing protein [Desulfolucanica intricata]